MIVVGLIGVISAISIPMVGNAFRNLRLSGDARALSNTMSLAKMRAASTFGRSRVYVDLGGRTYHIENQQAAGAPWVTEGGTLTLSSGVSFSFGGLTTPPPNTQAAIAQSPQCLTEADEAIGNTACVVFNSRGVPIDQTGGPTTADALYITDGTAVAGITVAATGLVRVWQSPASSATWTHR